MMDWALVLAADMASAVGADEKNRRMRNDIRKMRLRDEGGLIESFIDLDGTGQRDRYDLKVETAMHGGAVMRGTSKS